LRKNEPRIARTILKSCGKLSYENVQGVIEGKITDCKQLNITYLPEKCKGEEVLNTIILLNKIAVQLRKQRLHNGAIVNDQRRKEFTLDEKSMPIAYENEKVIFPEK